MDVCHPWVLCFHEHSSLQGDWTWALLSLDYLQILFWPLHNHDLWQQHLSKDVALSKGKLPGFYTFLFKDFIYLFLERGKGGRNRGRETSMCGCFSHTLNWGPGPQPRHVPWLGIEPATLWFAGRHSIHWAAPARTKILYFLKKHFIYLFFFRDRKREGKKRGRETPMCKRNIN